jgi:tetratricopeptide (TPR) repeat protein
LLCPECDALLASEVIAPARVVFRCRAAHGTFVPHAALDALPELDWVAKGITAPERDAVNVEGAIEVSSAQAHFDLAWSYREMGLLKDALEMIDKVLAIDPSWPDAQVIRAELIEQLKR